jgi:hypothetical protein
MPDPEEQLAGTRAQGDGPCVHPECETGMFLKDERITRYKDGWMHVYHASGWDDDKGPARKPGRKRAAKKTSVGGQSPDSGLIGPVGSETEVGAVPPTEPVDWNQTEPGLVYDMPETIYHADPWHTESVSNSDAKLLLDAPALFRWARDHHRPSTRSQNLGSAAHTRVLGEGAKLVKIDAAEYRTNDAKDARKQALAAGQIPLLGVRKYADKPCEWEVVDQMAEALERDPLAPHLFSAGRAEVSAFWTDPDTNVPRRARFDWLKDVVEGQRMVFPDYKSTGKDVSPGAFARSVADYGYEMQEYTYESALAALEVDVDARMVFVVQSTEPPYLVAVHQLTDRAREHGRARTLRALRRWVHCTATGHWYGWEGSVHQVDLPGWAYQQEELAQLREPTFDERPSP